MNAPSAFFCDCGHPPSEGAGTGYGISSKGTMCYTCCALDDMRVMRDTGRAVMYLVPTKETNRFELSNWPGSLRFPAYDVSHSKYGGGFGAQRTDAHFVGPDGFVWRAVNRGDMDLARCERINSRRVY